jgi:lysozyme family protein
MRMLNIWNKVQRNAKRSDNELAYLRVALFKVLNELSNYTSITAQDVDWYSVGTENIIKASLDKHGG